MLFRALPVFDYFEPTTLDEALALLAGGSGPSAVMAGGLSLLDDMKRGLREPDSVICIQRVDSLSGVAGDAATGLSIGALTTIREAEAEASISEGLPILAEALSTIHSTQVRSNGTLVGNVCVGTPASDILTALVALGAVLHVAGSDHPVEIGLECLCEDARRTCLRPGQLVTRIAVPARAAGAFGAYRNLTRTKNDVAKVAVAVEVTLADDGTCEAAAIAAGAVAPTVVRLDKAADRLLGSRLDKAAIEAAATAAAADPQVRPIDDLRSTAEYRREMVRVLTRRALQAAHDRSARD